MEISSTRPEARDQVAIGVLSAAVCQHRSRLIGHGQCLLGHDFEVAAVDIIVVMGMGQQLR